MAINNIYTDGIASGWKVHDASTFKANRSFEADVAIVGTGAGGGTAAEILSLAGLKVLLLEEGPLKTSDSFKDMDESRAYADLYQEGGARASSDGAVAILQGRSVGGSTTVNWTSSFRTPPGTLKQWADVHGVKGASVEEMAPWFARMEQRLGIAPWAQAPNANNAVLKRAGEKLGWDVRVIPRNVRGCWNSGYCGYGCPVNAKQSMLVSTIPEALRHGAELVHRLRVQRLQFSRGKVDGLVAQAMDAECIAPTGIEVQIRARHYIMAGGAINTPALLLRSDAPDPHGRLGKRTCIHPVNLVLAQMPERIDGFYGAPQSEHSDQFQWNGDFSRHPGYKLEIAPTYPALTSTIFTAYGPALAADQAQLPYTSPMLALLRDGFHPDSPGGEIRVDEDGRPLLDYGISDYLWRGFKQAFLTMAEGQFAAGAKRVLPSHLDGRWSDSWADAKAQIETLPYKKFRLSVFTAHLMGGCAMGEDPKQAVVSSLGRHHQVENLSVMDGSVFPTSIGANPQLSVYGLVCKNATQLVSELTGAAAAGSKPA
ncbi:MAG TPA: GMC family oxidoreductase [Stenotrophobium sp.]|jgi:choline dehydrogenase|nr:GMC family oxidoreductase [Stenotrophobium sp.]